MKYYEVVKKAQKAERKGYGKVEFQTCNTWLNGNQINLWTYWQGYQINDIDEKGVDILLVGQDWGNPENEKNECVISKIKDIQSGRDTFYEAVSATDKTLAKMFTVFGVDIMKKNPSMRLFFTNYSLGYRKGSETGGMTKTIMKQDEELFNDLVISIRPKIIICLGKITFEMVSGTNAKSYIETLKRGIPFKAPFPHEKNIHVYGVAHCGARGRNNVGGEENMMKSWMEIVDDYTAFSCNSW